MADEYVHPYVYIREEMEARGWDHIDLALAMTLDDGRSTEFNLLYLELLETASDPKLEMHWQCRLGDEGSRRLARAFGTSPEFFQNLEAAWLKGAPSAILRAKEADRG